MTDGPDTHGHVLEADPSDDLMAKLADTAQALEALADAARNIMCPGCDPTGEIAAQVRIDMAERFDVDAVDADLLLSHAADVRGLLMGLLMPPCGHDHDEQHGDE